MLELPLVDRSSSTLDDGPADDDKEAMGLHHCRISAPACINRRISDGISSASAFIVLVDDPARSTTTASKVASMGTLLDDNRLPRRDGTILRGVGALLVAISTGAICEAVDSGRMHC